MRVLALAALLQLAGLSLPPPAVAQVAITSNSTSAESISRIDFALLSTVETISKDATSTTVRITIENNTGNWYHVALLPAGGGVTASNLPQAIYVGPWSNGRSITATFKAGDSLQLFADASTNNPGILVVLGLDVLARLTLGQELPLDGYDLTFLAAAIHSPLADLGQAVVKGNALGAAAAIWDLVNEPEFAALRARLEALLGKPLISPGRITVAFNIAKYARLVIENLIYPDNATLTFKATGPRPTSGPPVVAWQTAPPVEMRSGRDYSISWTVTAPKLPTVTDARWDTSDPRSAARCNAQSNPICSTGNKASSASSIFTATVRAPAVSGPTVYKYVAHAVVNGVDVWSPEALVTVRLPTPAPTVSSVSPAPVPGLALPERQLIRVLGSGFTTSTRLTFVTGSERFPGRIPEFVSSSEVRYRIAVGNITASWTVTATNDGASSAPRGFSVVASADTAAPAIAIGAQDPRSTFRTREASVLIAGSMTDDVASGGLTWSSDRGGSGVVVVASSAWTLLAPLQLGTNRISLRATDASGNGMTASVTVERDPAMPARPPAPELHSISVAGRAYVVSWSAVASATYLLEEDHNPGFSAPARIATSSTSVSFAGKGPGTYSYRVIAVVNGDTSQPSDRRTATVSGNTEPMTIVAASPADGSTGAGRSVQISWQATHPDGDAMRFDVFYVPTDTNFFFEHNAVSRSQSGSSFQLPNLPYGRRVSWGIRATDSKGNVHYSQMFHFETAPYTVVPSGAVTINNGAATTLSASVTLNLSWSAAPRDVSLYMRFSNDGATWTEWTTAAGTAPWNLADGRYGGIDRRTHYTAYAQFRDQYDNQSPIYSDIIERDAGAAGRVLLNGRTFATIQDAIDAAVPGDTVYLTAGVHRVPTSLPTPNARRPWDTNRAVGVVMGRGVILQGAGSDQTTVIFENAFYGIVDAEDAVISGMTLTNSSTFPSRTTVLLESPRSTVRHCLITGAQFGVYAGFSPERRSEDAVLLHNVITSNGQGVFVEASSTNLRLLHNTIASNSPTAGVLTLSQSVTLRNNVIAFNGYGIGASSAAGLVIDHNLVFPADTAYNGLADQTGLSGNIAADPQFEQLAARNFQLKPGSAAIDSGAPTGAPFAGGAPDRGAFELGARGSVRINSNQGSAAFLLSGPGGESAGHGTSSELANLAAGVYALSFQSLDGLYPPTYRTFEITAGAQLTVEGAYLADTVGPSGGMAINHEEYATEFAEASITLDFSDEITGLGSGAEMQFSNDGADWSAPEPYSTLKTGWNLAVGFGATASPGLHTVYARVSDAAGNWATAIDTVLYVPERRTLQTTAFSSIQAAIDAAAPGDIVQLPAATFREDLQLRPGVTVRGAGSTLTRSTAGTSSFSMAANSQLEGIGGFLVVDAQAGLAIIQNNRFEASRNQIEVSGSGRTIIRNNVFKATSSSGIAVVVNGLAGGGDTVVENNTFSTIWRGVWIGNAVPATRVYVRNNVFSGMDIALIDSGTADVSHKHLYSSFNLFGSIASGPFGEADPFFATANLHKGFEGGDATGDPQFVNPAAADYRLGPSSPAIDSGAPERSSMDVDLSRNDRGYLGGRRGAFDRTPPAIERPPQSVVTSLGAAVTLTVVATGSGTLTYQWVKNGAEMPGATTPSLTFPAVSPLDLGEYAVRISGAAGTVTSSGALISLPADTAPTFTVSVAAANGSVTVAPQAAAFLSGTRVTMTARAAAGYRFAGWSGDLLGSAASITFEVTSDVTATADFAPVVGSSLVFTDDPIVTGTTPIKAVHITELRLLIDQIRVRSGLAAGAWQETSLVGRLVSAQDVVELRTALAEAYQRVGEPAPNYSETPARGSQIRAVDVANLRAAIRAIY